MPIRIALSGSAGTGKTSLAGALAAALAIPLSEDPVRPVLAGRSYRGLEAAARAELAEEVLQIRLAREEQLDSFVADGSTVELAAFWLRWVTPGLADSARSRRFLEKCRAHAARYTRVAVLPFGGIPLVSDGFRTPDSDYQYGMHCLGMGILLDWRIAAVELSANTLLERVEICRRLG